MIEKLIRPIIHDFSPYQWELSTAEVARRYNLPMEAVIRFDTNTSPFLPFDYLEKLEEHALIVPQVNEYGDASYAGLREDLAAYNNCTPEQIVIGAGADELVDMIAKLFLNNGDKAVTASPTYPVYAISTEIMGATILNIPRGPAPAFSIDTKLIAETALEQQAKVIWLCNPNNPTATADPVSAVEEILERIEGRVAVAIDEAYFEFSGVTALPLVDRYPNLLIIRTFSKAFSLAGARVGCVIAQPQTAFYLNQVRPPNSVANLSVVKARYALTAPAIAEMRQRVEFILAEKARFAEALAPYCEAVYPSAANFLLARIGSPAQADQIAQALLENGIVVRRPGTMPGHFRVTVRLPEENQKFLEVLQKFS